MSIADRLTARLTELNIEQRNILTFAQEDLRLDLFPAQKFILKVFYSLPLSDDINENCIEIGDRFNERVLYRFSEVEFLDFLYKSNRINVNKISPDQFFLEIVFAIGRRGTKTTLSSIITLHTIQGLLMLPNPHKYFGILEEDEIGVAIVSNNREGADRQFRTISKMIYRSPFFKKHLVKDPTNGQLFLRSNRILESKDEALTQLMKNKGDILISTFAANPNVRGASNIVTISDEFHHFLDSDVSNKKNPLDRVVYESLTPSTSGFVMEDGRPAGRNFFLSSPNGQKGMFWDMYQRAMSKENRGKETHTLVINVPSHWVNPKLKSTTLISFYNKSERSYEQEYEAKFLKGSGAWLLSITNKVYAAFDESRPNVMLGAQSGFEYFIGIDFGLGSDGTAFVVGHYEPFRPHTVSKEERHSFDLVFGTQEIRDVVVIDYIWYKLPEDEPGGVLNVKSVIKELKALDKAYKPVSGSHDQWSGEVFAQLLEEEGLKHIKKVPATQQSNSDLAKTFRQLISEGRIVFPHHPDFQEELFRLKETVGRDGLVKVEDTEFHDDMFDACTRAVWQVYNSKSSNLDSYKRHAMVKAKNRSRAPKGLPIKVNRNNIRRMGQIRSGVKR